DRSDFDRTFSRHWNPLGDIQRLVEIIGVDEVISPELFSSLCERSVGHESFPVSDANAGRSCRGVQGGGVHILSLRMNFLRKLNRLQVTVLPFGFTQGLLLEVNEQHISHLCLHPKVERRGLKSTPHQKSYSRLGAVDPILFDR